MTATHWVTRILSALLALALLLGSLLVVVEIVAAALARPPRLVPYPEWTSWLRSHSWNDWIVNSILVGFVVVGLLLLLFAFRRGKPATLSLAGRTPGVIVTATRRSVEKSLAAAASRTTGVAGATASVGRSTARIAARTATRSEPELRKEVESAVNARLDSLGLERSMRTRVNLSTKGSR